MNRKPVTARTARIATVLERVRGGYGALQLAAPALVSKHVLSRPLDPPARAVARVLGARQLGQALASGDSPSYPVLALGVEVDLLHAGSMIVLGLTDRRRRRTAFLDALIAASFALAGALAARTSTTDQPPPPASTLPTLITLRESCADRLAGALVPGYRARSAAAGRRGGTPHLTGSMQATFLRAGSAQKR